MATNAIKLPEGFVLDSAPTGLPEGFVLDEQPPQWEPTQTYGKPISEEVNGQEQYQVGGKIGFGAPEIADHYLTNIDRTVGALEVPTAIGSSAVADLYANYSAALTGGGPEARQRVVDAMSYQPRSEAAQSAMQSIASGAQTVGNVVGNVEIPGTDGTKINQLSAGERALGNASSDGQARMDDQGRYVIGGPLENELKARLMEMTPALAQSVMTAMGMPRANLASGNTSMNANYRGLQYNTNPAQAPKPTKLNTGELAPMVDDAVIRKDKLAVGRGDRITAGYKLVDDKMNGGTKVVKDKYAAEAIKQGFDEGKIGNLSTASRTDKTASLKMIDRVKNTRVDPKTGVRKRPIHVIGDELSEELAHVKKQNTISGQQVKIAANELKGVPIDIWKPIENFRKWMDEAGVNVKEVNGNMAADFSNTSLPRGARPVIKEIVRQMNRLSKRGDPDAFAAHQLKEIIYDNVKYGNRALPAGDKAERALKAFANELNQAMRGVSKNYGKANQTYADTIEVINDFQRYVGKNENLFDDYSPRALSNISRRIMGNAQTGGAIMRSTDDLQKIANKYGGNFDADFNIQLMIADELDNIFPPAAQKSLHGEMAKSMLKQDKAALLDRAVDYVRGINEDNAIKSFRAFVFNSMDNPRMTPRTEFVTKPSSALPATVK